MNQAKSILVNTGGYRFLRIILMRVHKSLEEELGHCFLISMLETALAGHTCIY